MTPRPSTVLIDTMLSIIPSLPRTVLDRLVTDMIDRMDELDGDPDLEDDEREPEWHMDSTPFLRLPGARSRSGHRFGRLHSYPSGHRRRRRPMGYHWRKRGHH